MTNRRDDTEFCLSDKYLSVNDKATWQDWEVPKFEKFAAEIRAGLAALQNRPTPDDCAGTYASNRLADELKDVESRLGAIDSAPIEAAREALLDACQVLNQSHDAVANADTAEGLVQAQAAVTICQRDQLRLWDAFVSAAEASRLPLIEATFPLYAGRKRSLAASRLGDIAASKSDKANSYIFGYHNAAIDVAVNHARDACQDLDSFVWDVVEQGRREKYRTDEAQDRIEVFMGEAMRKAKLPFDVPDIFKTDPEEIEFVA